MIACKAEWRSGPTGEKKKASEGQKTEKEGRKRSDGEEDKKEGTRRRRIEEERTEEGGTEKEGDG